MRVGKLRIHTTCSQKSWQPSLGPFSSALLGFNKCSLSFAAYLSLITIKAVSDVTGMKQCGWSTTILWYLEQEQNRSWPDYLSSHMHKNIVWKQHATKLYHNTYVHTRCLSSEPVILLSLCIIRRSHSSTLYLPGCNIENVPIKVHHSTQHT